MTVTEVVTASMTSQNTEASSAPATPSAPADTGKSLGSVDRFYSPSRSIYCAHEGELRYCTLMVKSNPTSTENALSCDSDHYPSPTAVVMGMNGSSSPCWFTAQPGQIPASTPTLEYDSTARLGDLDCLMKITGVRCSNGTDGFFVSKQAFMYQKKGHWYPSNP